MTPWMRSAHKHPHRPTHFVAAPDKTAATKGACRRRNAFIPSVLLFVVLPLYWNASMTSRLPSEGMLPTLVREVDDDAKSGKVLIDPPRLANTIAADENMHQVDAQSGKVLMEPPRLANTIGGYFPRTINMDGGTNPHPVASDDNGKRRIHIDRQMLYAWKHIEDDGNYPTIQDSPLQEECIPMASWQTDSYPNCNVIHELDLHAKARSEAFYYVASGGYNDVFRLIDERFSPTALNADPDLALKILSPGQKHRAGIPEKKAYSSYNYDVVRRDALVLERLTKSSFVLPLHGYCGFAVIVPYADGGTLASALAKEWSRGDKGWGKKTSTARLKYAMDAAIGLADIHEIDVVHADLTIKQYMVRNGTLQLGDFNQGILLRRNSTAPDSACSFQMTKNYGTTRAPEEYSHKPQTSAVDVFSLGSILYHILTGRKVWSKYKKNKAQNAVIKGMLPKIDQSILNSSDPVDKLLKEALDMCYIYEPSKRATAREVATFLHKSWKELSIVK